MYKKSLFFVAILLLAILSVTFHSCVHAPYVMPADQQTYDPGICFEQDILPIFIANCTKSGCHDAASHAGGYVLDNFQNIRRKGIVPGNYAASKIYESVAWAKGENKMPVGLAALNAGQLNLLRRWIAAGAVDSGACYNICDSTNYTYSGAIAPMMEKFCLGCHNTPSSPGGSLVDYNSVMTATVSGKLIGNITHQAGYNAMPPGYQLSYCQIAQVKKWLAAGAPDN